ncbi:MAG TPA: hypothetical protein DCS37_01710, partial [Clostridiales bacterium]|nr:hypothetical protein [Clostridiales bacterium]
INPLREFVKCAKRLKFVCDEQMCELLFYSAYSFRYYRHKTLKSLFTFLRFGAIISVAIKGRE